MNPNLIYPRSGDRQTVYLKNVVSNSNIEVGDFTIYNDFVNDPRDFEKNNVLYRYPINGDRLKIGRFCSIACGAKFLLQAEITRCVRFRLIPSRFSLTNGTLIRAEYAKHGTTKAILNSAMMFG